MPENDEKCRDTGSGMPTELNCHRGRIQGLPVAPTKPVP
jgi:hypothetical protein